jgi:hypothetical protein
MDLQGKSYPYMPIRDPHLKCSGCCPKCWIYDDSPVNNCLTLDPLVKILHYEGITTYISSQKWKYLEGVSVKKVFSGPKGLFMLKLVHFHIVLVKNRRICGKTAKSSKLPEHISHNLVGGI